MDVLGYSDLIRQSLAAGTGNETLRRLHNALSNGRQWLEDKHTHDDLQTARYALKAFTDNIVIGWPVHDDAESEFGTAFFKLAAFQLQMVLGGYFVRGALSVGDAYVDEVAVFGAALSESHAGESTLARDPRIILTESAVRATRKHLKYYAKPEHAPHVRHVLQDADGQWFLNYLESVLMAEDEQGPFDELRRHKNAVEQNLTRHRSSPPVWSKYAWAATYHNYFCGLHKHHFDASYLINVSEFGAQPSLIA